MQMFSDKRGETPLGSVIHYHQLIDEALCLVSVFVRCIPTWGSFVFFCDGLVMESDSLLKTSPGTLNRLSSPWLSVRDDAHALEPAGHKTKGESEGERCRHETWVLGLF